MRGRFLRESSRKALVLDWSLFVHQITRKVCYFFLVRWFVWPNKVRLRNVLNGSLEKKRKHVLPKKTENLHRSSLIKQERFRWENSREHTKRFDDDRQRRISTLSHLSSGRAFIFSVESHITGHNLVFPWISQQSYVSSSSQARYWRNKIQLFFPSGMLTTYHVFFILSIHVFTWRLSTGNSPRSFPSHISRFSSLPEGSPEEEETEASTHVATLRAVALKHREYASSNVILQLLRISASGKTAAQQKLQEPRQEQRKFTGL